MHVHTLPSLPFSPITSPRSSYSGVLACPYDAPATWSPVAIFSHFPYHLIATMAQRSVLPT